MAARLVRPELESVVPASERPVPIVALLIAPVPLPIKNPESVVDPVPPFATASVPAKEESVRQLPPTAKQPVARLMPFPAVVVPVPRVNDPKDADWEKRLVDDAVVVKKDVLVALPKTFLPEKVLLSIRSVEEAAPASEVR